MNTKDILRKKNYEVIYKEDCITSQDFSPDIIADFLIQNSADAIGLPMEYFSCYFPYKKYFDDNGNPFLIPLIPFFLIVFAINFIYKQAKNTIFFFLKRPIITQKIETKQPLTALQFADIMIDYLEKYKTGYQFKPN